MASVPDARRLDFKDWANAMIVEFPADDLPMPDHGWQAWGLELYSRPSFQVLPLPDPRAFSDWRTWATRLKDVVG